MIFIRILMNINESHDGTPVEVERLGSVTMRAKLHELDSLYLYLMITSIASL